MSPLITQQQYESVMGKNPSKVKNPDAPVTNVSFFDAVEFCKKLTEADALNSDVLRGSSIYGSVKWKIKAKGYRLITEEEYELAVHNKQLIPSELWEMCWNEKQNNTIVTNPKNKEELTVSTRRMQVLRGNNSGKKRGFYENTQGNEKTGFRVVLNDMTEWGFPEQKAVNPAAKPTTTIAGLDEYLTKVEASKTPAADGYIHEEITFAEIIDGRNDNDTYKIKKILEKHQTVMLVINMRDCQYKVPENDYDLSDWENVQHVTSLLWRAKNIEGFIPPAASHGFGTNENDVIKWIQIPAEMENFDVECFNDDGALKYIFVERDKQEGDSESVPYTGVKTQIIYGTTAAEYKKIHDDFDAPVDFDKNEEGCVSKFNHGAIYWGSDFDLSITIPQRQVKKQTATIQFVFAYDENFVMDTLPLKIEKSASINLKKIKTDNFKVPFDYSDSDAPMRIKIIFSDGEVVNYYDSQLLIVY